MGASMGTAPMMPGAVMAPWPAMHCSDHLWDQRQMSSNESSFVWASLQGLSFESLLQKQPCHNKYTDVQACDRDVIQELLTKASPGEV